MKVAIAKIKIKSRMRNDVGDINPLIDSIRRNGLINPITLTEKYELLAGYRRLLAAQSLGWEEIDCHMVKVKSKKDRFQIEVDENTMRKEFTSLELELIEEERTYLYSTGIKKFFLFIKNVLKAFITWLRLLFSRSRNTD